MSKCGVEFIELGDKWRSCNLFYYPKEGLSIYDYQLMSVGCKSQKPGSVSQKRGLFVVPYFLHYQVWYFERYKKLTYGQHIFYKSHKKW